MANTKLNKAQKTSLKRIKAEFLNEGGQIFYSEYTGFTCAFKPEFPGAKMARISVSFASSDEDKFRRKVGEFYALYNLEVFDRYISLPVSPDNFPEWADNFEDGLYSF